MKKKIISKSKSKKQSTKTKTSKDGIVINNKVVVHSPAKRTYKKRSSKSKKLLELQQLQQLQAQQAQLSRVPINIYNENPPKRYESQDELLKMAQNYVSNPLLIENEPVNTPQNQVIIKPKPTRKPRQIKYKSISQQLGTRIEEPENGEYLKGIKTKKELFQVLKSHYDIPEKIYKKTTLKNKNEMIDLLLNNKDDYLKGSSKPEVSQDSSSGGSTIHQTEPNESLSDEAIEPIIQKESTKKESTVKQPRKIKIKPMKAPTLIQSIPESQNDLTSDSSLINLYEPESKVIAEPAPNNFNDLYNNNVSDENSIQSLGDAIASSHVTVRKKPT